MLTGRGEGRRSEGEITLFDSTGLAIQDLGIAAEVYEAWRAGLIEAPTVSLGSESEAGTPPHGLPGAG